MCSEPGCSDKCVPAFMPFTNGMSMPAKAIKTMECPIMAYLVSLANRVNAGSSSRKLKVSHFSLTNLYRLVCKAQLACVYMLGRCRDSVMRSFRI